MYIFKCSPPSCAKVLPDTHKKCKRSAVDNNFGKLITDGNRKCRDQATTTAVKEERSENREEGTRTFGQAGKGKTSCVQQKKKEIFYNVLFAIVSTDNCMLALF